MTNDHYNELKADIAANTSLTKEVHAALIGTLDGKKGALTRISALETTVDGPEGEPQLGLKAKVRDFDNTRTKVIAYAGGAIGVITLAWFLFEKYLAYKPMF